MRSAGKLVGLVFLLSVAGVLPAGAAPGDGAGVAQLQPSWEPDRVVTRAGRIWSGLDASGDLYFALDEEDAAGQSDGRLDRLYLAQANGSDAFGHLVSEPFSGWISYWGNRLEVGKPGGQIVARVFVAAAGLDSRLTRWLEQDPTSSTVRVIGLVENVPSPERAATVEEFLDRVTSERAQRSIRLAALFEEDIRNPNPGGGGSGGGGGSDCDSGGPGSSQCSATYGGDGCSVTCQAGYYACCERGGILTASECYCVRE